jgi:hypothetical protein
MLETSLLNNQRDKIFTRKLCFSIAEICGIFHILDKFDLQRIFQMNYSLRFYNILLFDFEN